MFCCCINERSQYAEKGTSSFTSELFARLKGSGYFGICYKKNDDLFVVKGDTVFFRGAGEILALRFVGTVGFLIVLTPGLLEGAQGENEAE